MTKKNLYSSLSLFLYSFFSVLNAQGTVDAAKTTNYTEIANIVLAGMIIVFASLIIILIVVSLLQYTEKREIKNRSKEKEAEKSKEKKKSLKISSITPINKKEKSKPIDHHIQLAAITTIFLYETEIEKRSQMLLTMKRAKISAWQESARLLMSNYAYYKNIKKQ
ncbi:MAG: OadG family protein [Candidatus Cloacimonetes bacterium]|nr:OadG family protein [Candidatus Cloacimonadota bacterium]MBS3767455.1 OadG family protein [Candidatus Cloacimonadota bacterium]